jgi:twitching motility protein PilI
VGLLVDAVVGMKHFREQDETTTPPELSDQLSCYVTTSFGRDSEHFGVFSLARLLESADFMDAAV